jgi:protein-tyrosine phosphatase
MAEGIMRNIFEERSISGEVDSAGTADWNVGRSADHRAISVAHENGIDITAHRARQIRKDDFDHFDLILAMDFQNENALKKLAPLAARPKIRLLCEDGEISDPYSGNVNTFRQTYKLIEHCCKELIQALPEP